MIAFDEDYDFACRSNGFTATKMKDDSLCLALPVTPGKTNFYFLDGTDFLQSFGKLKSEIFSSAYKILKNSVPSPETDEAREVAIAFNNLSAALDKEQNKKINI